MCGEVTPDKEEFYKVGSKVILLEEYQDPKDTGSFIQITNLTDAEGGFSCFMGYEELENVKPLETWWKSKRGQKQLIIRPKDFDYSLRTVLDDVLYRETNLSKTKRKKIISKFSRYVKEL